MVLFNSLYLHISNTIMFYSFLENNTLIRHCLSYCRKWNPPPFNIKTVSFIQNDQNVIPIFSLGSGWFNYSLMIYMAMKEFLLWNYTLRLQLETIWNPKNEYLQGFDNQRIQNYNSFNTLQLYPIIHCQS
jgi:hypothetical protein